MTNEPLASILRSWLRQREVPAPDSMRTATRVVARLPRVRRRGRWWLPTLRRSHPPIHQEGAPQLPSQGRATDDFPTLTRRTRLMFSPVKAIVAGALVFALGGIFLVAQPFDRPQSAVPGAGVTEPPVAVDVTQHCDNIFASPIVCTWTASDPRLTGTLTHEWVADVSPPEPDDLYSVGWADATLEGPEGDWTGRLYVVWGAQPASTLFAFLSGDGAYEGWQYVGSAVDDGESPGNAPWYGVAYQGELPPYGP
jgi:hypothetical protein